MALYDITPAIRPGLPVWPGDTAYSEDATWEMGPDCPVRVSRVVMSTHTGAHADAPSHYDPDGVGVGGLDLERYLGRCRVVDATVAVGAVTVAELQADVVAGDRRILIRTRPGPPAEVWDPAFTAISAAAVDWLAGRGVVLIGVDTPSLDPEQSKTMEAHRAVARHGMAILEGLDLSAVDSGEYELIAPPIHLANLDAAPVRAVLRSLDHDAR